MGMRMEKKRRDMLASMQVKGHASGEAVLWEGERCRLGAGVWFDEGTGEQKKWRGWQDIG